MESAEARVITSAVRMHTTVAEVAEVEEERDRRIWTVWMSSGRDGKRVGLRGGAGEMMRAMDTTVTSNRRDELCELRQFAWDFDPAEWDEL